jgi:hypothetical protein
MALQAKANTRILTSQATVHVGLLLKVKVLADSRGHASGSSTSSVTSVAARPPLLPWSPTLQGEHHAPTSCTRTRRHDWAGRDHHGRRSHSCSQVSWSLPSTSTALQCPPIQAWLPERGHGRFHQRTCPCPTTCSMKCRSRHQPPMYGLGRCPTFNSIGSIL